MLVAGRGGGRVPEPRPCEPCAGASPQEVRGARTAAGVVPSYKRVDTCAAEFEAQTPYLYSSYDGSCEAAPSASKKVRPVPPPLPSRMTGGHPSFLSVACWCLAGWPRA